MDIPLRVIVRGTPLSPAAASGIEADVQALRSSFPRILYCEVHVEGPGIHGRRGRFQVRMIVGVAGRDIIVSRQKSDTLHEALTRSFRVAGRRLEDHARLARGDVKRRARQTEHP